MDPQEVFPDPFNPGRACSPDDLRAINQSQGISDIYWGVLRGRLWHYTSWESYLGILEQRALFASDLRYLNDTREYMHGLELLNALQEKLVQSASQLEASFLFNLRSAVSSGPPVFVFSLSELGDDLDQWRAYCPPQGGVAIGFETGRLQMHAEPQGFRLLQCIYDRATQEARLLALLQEALDAFRVHLAQGLNPQRAGFLCGERFSQQFVELASSLKDPAFAGEREWRLVRSDMSLVQEHKIKSRHRRGSLVPYLPLRFTACRRDDFYAWPIAWLIIGPTAHPALASDAARAAMRSVVDDNWWAQAIDSVVLRFQSQVPYRGWW